MSGLTLALWVARSLLFLAAAIPTVIYAWRQGGQPERVTALLIVLAVAATTIIPRATFSQLVWPLFAVDLAMLAGIVGVALVADRYWPLYFAATHLLAVALHGVRAYDATLLAGVYARLGGELGYPTLLILAIGTWRHAHRATDVDWSWQVSKTTT